MAPEQTTVNCLGQIPVVDAGDGKARKAGRYGEGLCLRGVFSRLSVRQLCFCPYQCCNCARVRKQEGELCTVSIKEFSFRGNSKALGPPALLSK